jgi:hypothetical protein
MRYAIKNIKTGQYIFSGPGYYQWTSDIFYARAYKTKEAADKAMADVNTNAKCKVVAIELKEVDENEG